MKVGDRVGCSILNDSVFIGEATQVDSESVLIELDGTKKWHVMWRDVDDIKPVTRRSWTTTQADIDCQGRY